MDPSIMNHFSHGLENQVTESYLNSTKPFSASILRESNRPNPLICDDAAKSKMSSRRGSTRFTPYDRHCVSRKKVSWADGSRAGDHTTPHKLSRDLEMSQTRKGILRVSSVSGNKFNQTADNASGHDVANSFEDVKKSLKKASNIHDLNHNEPALDMAFVEPLGIVTSQFESLNINNIGGRLYFNTRTTVRSLGIEENTFHAVEPSFDASRTRVERNGSVGGLDARLQSLTSHSDENKYNRETVKVMNEGDQYHSDALSRGMYLD